MISVIVPIYNAEKFLSECLESILAQTFTDFELLLIDDGSKDNSGKICDEYAAKDSRIRVRHIANGGVTAARKLGVEVAVGEWITFVDADDTIPTDAFERFSKLFSADTDIIIGQIDVDRINIPEYYSLEEYRYGCISGKVRVEACGKCIRRRLFTEKVLDIPREIRMGEDMLMHIRLSYITEKKIYVLPVPNHVYNYRKHETQCTSTFKRTLDYEFEFHKHLKKSVPESEHNLYSEATIKSRLNAYRQMMMLYVCYKSVSRHPFYTELINDIRKSNYNLTWSDKMFLAFTNNFFRFFLITIVKLKSRLI